MKNLNAVYSRASMRRRYEVWFLRIGLADGSGAWWFRYLLLNPGRPGCEGNVSGLPVQVWATWFPRGARAQSFIQGFSKEELRLSGRNESPFSLEIGRNGIDESSCRGAIESGGHKLEWRLKWHSTYSVTLSDKGWIGFSRSPHFDAVFSGEVRFDGQVFTGEPLGFGVQGHNCGYRHRNEWTWTHACFLDSTGSLSAFEALIYEMPFGLRFRKAVLWHNGQAYVFHKFRQFRRDRDGLHWVFECFGEEANVLAVQIDGSSECLHRLPYLKTDCAGSFDVANNSLSQARIKFQVNGATGELVTSTGAVLEMAG